MNSLPDLKPYLQLFKGREDWFALQGEDFYFPVKRVLDEYYIRRHLDGDLTLGLYVLNSISCCNLICIDIDISKSELHLVNFKNPVEKYANLKSKLDAVLEVLISRFNVPSEAILLEETGGRGYHIWVFFDEAVNGQIVVKFGAALKAHLDFEVEFFPKQGLLTKDRKYGNLIKLPLGVHRKYGLRSSFFRLTPDGILTITDTVENLAYLRSLVPMQADAFKASVAAIIEELPIQEESIAQIFSADEQRPQFDGDPSILLTQCTALRNLKAKAESGTRLSHSEAFTFADVMLSVADGADIIHSTLRHSLAGAYDRNRTQNELERIYPLHPPTCLTLIHNRICPGYCKESVRRRNEDPLVPRTTPCSVWLKKKPTIRKADTENLLERIGTVENLKRVFFQLKQYHEYEDTVFFDCFDFEEFERVLEENCRVLATALLTRSEIPFLGYMPVAFPKKVNEDQQLEYRGMVFSTIYDQAPIQAIFNIVAPTLECEFQKDSYGYRWNSDPSTPYRIFEDWREVYPRFRNDIMAVLKRYPNGFHICCDVRGYYDHVDHTILLEQLRKFIPDVYLYQFIERTVRAYSFVQNGGCGLPQGPAYARLLANLYLNEFDVFASHLATGYFRYVDDFVLVFETEGEADAALERIVRHLAELGLELSQDEAKQAVITPNTNISRVWKTLDKIHYGILEGTRHVEHLDPQAVADFMEAVRKQSVSPVNFEELIKINEALPSLLYVVSKETLFPHQLLPRIIDIVEYMIQHKWFFPKKLKTIFYRLLDLESDENRLHRLFSLMDPVHKIYFLLTVYGSWQSKGDHRTLLERLVRDGLKDDSSYVLGFTLAIAPKMGLSVDSMINRHELMLKLSASDNFFPLLKWLPTINYLDLPDDERAAIRGIIVPKSPDMLKMLILSRMDALPNVYVDGVYLKGLLVDSNALILQSAINLLVVAKDGGEVFDTLVQFITYRLSFKPLVIALVSQRIFEKRAAAGMAEIENLKSLYTNIPDNELKQSMIGSLSHIMQYGLGCDEEFAKQHREIDRYNECFLFEMMDMGTRYNYLELIPESRLHSNMVGDLDVFKAIVDDFGVKGVLPHSSVFYDSGKREIRIEYKTEGRYHLLAPGSFSLADESVIRVCELVSQVFRKACYFHRFTRKVPHISPENLLIDEATGSMMFQTIGRSLCELHVVAGMKVGDEETDIAMMLGSLLEVLIFKSRSECEEFLNAKYHSGINAFLALFIKRLKSKDPGHRFSSARFEYLVDQVNRTFKQQKNPLRVEIVYLRERLKGTLFRYNTEIVTWHGVCKVLERHLSDHLRAICNRESLRDFPFRSRILFTGQGNRHLHVVTKHLLNLALCRSEFTDVEKSDPSYLDLIEFLILYASICIEVLAFARALWKIDTLQKLVSSPVLSHDRVMVRAGDFEKEFTTGDLSSIVINQTSQQTNDFNIGLSLRQLSLSALFWCNIEIRDATITVLKPQGVSEELFGAFAHACLVRIPNIELAVKKELERIFLVLRSNEDLGTLSHLEEMKETVRILGQDLRRVRASLHVIRLYGRADGRYFPPDVRFWRLFHRAHRVKEYTLPGCALTNNFPSSQQGYRCSWDISNKTLTNLMIPGEGLHTLIQDLTNGKFFGFKLSYLYSGKLMAIWDGAAFILAAVSLAVCKSVEGSTMTSFLTKGVCGFLAYPLGALAVILISKLLIIDLGHWSSRYHKVKNFIYRQFTNRE